jgi:preprotein translocase subunit SecG
VDIILLVLHVFLSLGIIGLVLLQKGSGASAGASFGGGGGGSVFGATGSSNFLSKSTAILATAFFINSLVLAYLASHRDVQTDSILDAITTPAVEVPVEVPVDIPTDIPAPENVPATDSESATEGDVPAPAGE